MTNYIIPETGFIRLPAVLKVIPVGKTTWWEGVKKGRFQNLSSWDHEQQLGVLRIFAR